MSYFVETVKRLYISGKIDEAKINDLCKSGKLTEADKSYILNVK